MLEKKPTYDFYQKCINDIEKNKEKIEKFKENFDEKQFNDDDNTIDDEMSSLNPMTVIGVTAIAGAMIFKPLWALGGAILSAFLPDKDDE